MIIKAVIDMKQGQWYTCDRCVKERGEGMCLFKFNQEEESDEPQEKDEDGEFSMIKSKMLGKIGQKCPDANNCTFYHGCVRTLTKEQEILALAEDI